MKSYTYIVASLHGRTGKTLLARLFADHALFTGQHPEIFDTDAADRKLAACFPGRAVVTDLDRVTDQMKLFDTLTAPAAVPRVVDVMYRVFHKFFRLAQEIGYVEEAHRHEIEPVIVYIPDREAASYEQGRLLRDHFKQCHFIVVENALLGKPDKHVQQSEHYKALMAHELNLYMPLLDPMFASVVDDPKLSLSEFMSNSPVQRPPGELSLAYLSLEARASIQVWLNEMFNEIRRLSDVIKLRADLSFKRPL
ncbi:MAG TPA: hypothetical protein VKT73_14320 [Xanthobacteraceae bacterium]|nr:hypothetical protein [Xanthobacteraceae bacterium]